jgi:hypothetical protein
MLKNHTLNKNFFKLQATLKSVVVVIETFFFILTAEIHSNNCVNIFTVNRHGRAYI